MMKQLLIGALAVLFMGPAQAADGIALDNAYVRVTQDAAPCASATAAGCEERVIVAMGDVAVASGNSQQTLKRGDVAVFKAGESYHPPTGAYFEVAIKPGHPPIKGPPEVIPAAKNTNVFENERFFIYQERLAAGDTRARHSHAQRVEIRINQGPRLVQIVDGRDTPLQPPEIVNWREPMIHVTTNVGDMPLWNFILEFKPQ
jgi:quercetin dioxygenase-like cupin family protein